MSQSLERRLSDLESRRAAVDEPPLLLIVACDHGEGLDMSKPSEALCEEARAWGQRAREHVVMLERADAGAGEWRITNRGYTDGKQP